MKKEDVAASLAQKTGWSKGDSEIILDAVFQSIFEALVSGEKVQIVGFGTFELKERAPRVGRNPHANQPVNIPARRVPYFKPGKALRDAVIQSSNFT